MKSQWRSQLIERSVPALFVCMVGFGAQPAKDPAMPAEYQQVLSTLGKQGDFKANVLKINIPRNDVHVTVDGVSTPTPFGFGGWLAMTKGTGGMNVMMGDLVLLEDEVNPVMSLFSITGSMLQRYTIIFSSR